MDRIEIGSAGIVVALLLIGLRVPVGVVLGLVSFVGIASITSMKAAWGILTAIPYSFISNWSLSAVPMFLLMGYIASQVGLTRGLFSSMRMFIGAIPGGLASATVVASALFASASGSSVATAAAFSRIAVPEMLRSGYKASLATGAVAASGTLGSLIPPSVLMILYGIFTGTSIGALFVGGLLPGILSAAVYIAMITIRSWADPSLAPVVRETYTREDRIAALKDTWPLPVLIIGILGGIFAGVFSPTEAGAIGAGLAILIALFRRSLSMPALSRAIIETAEGTSTVFIIAIGASMFSVFMGLSTLPNALSGALLPHVDNIYVLIALISVLFIVLGMFVESISLMLLTLPVIQPILTGMNVDMVWFGIIVIKLLEIGLITPPVGLNVYVMKSSLGDQVSLTQMFKGAFWFILMDIVTLALLVEFPSITLLLPQLMQ
ncbi:C4-dicarboxylate ABC transporter [Zhengella mangrovi]|uniref:TRAP transporter large permease protein n=1 Tax=Zhengella mangrovi TaxID=1982044 RepID=A0A2G1QI39_9HYPH|nr:TRAP transporter large permease [Zhengella mangrovi]PHP65185.1 C4-dicarboxylate ABC transporter [Zhengella mangrovi]